MATITMTPERADTYRAITGDARSKRHPQCRERQRCFQVTLDSSPNLMKHSIKWRSRDKCVSDTENNQGDALLAKLLSLSETLGLKWQRQKVAA